MARRRPPPLPGLPVLEPGATAELVLPAPVPASHARYGPGGGYHEEPYRSWREAAAATIAARWTWATIPRHTPLQVRIVALSERPKDRPEWCPPELWRAGGRVFRPVRPDVENFEEAVLDALMPGKVSVAGGGKLRTRGAIEDDASVVRLHGDDLLAAVGETPRTLVWVTVLRSLVP